MVIIPAIDIIKGQCVRLIKGDYERKQIYHEDPIVVAKSFEEAGIERLHLVDLDGAKAKNMVNFSITVGKGIGPFTLAPVLLAVLTISIVV